MSWPYCTIGGAAVLVANRERERVSEWFVYDREGEEHEISEVHTHRREEPWRRVEIMN